MKKVYYHHWRLLKGEVQFSGMPVCDAVLGIALNRGSSQAYCGDIYLFIYLVLHLPS
jgi:hypothetical protein